MVMKYEMFSSVWCNKELLIKLLYRLFLQKPLRNDLEKLQYNENIIVFVFSSQHGSEMKLTKNDSKLTTPSEYQMLIRLIFYSIATFARWLGARFDTSTTPVVCYLLLYLIEIRNEMD